MLVGSLSGLRLRGGLAAVFKLPSALARARVMASDAGAVGDWSGVSGVAWHVGLVVLAVGCGELGAGDVAGKDGDCGTQARQLRAGGCAGRVGGFGFAGAVSVGFVVSFTWESFPGSCWSGDVEKLSPSDKPIIWGQNGRGAWYRASCSKTVLWSPSPVFQGWGKRIAAPPRACHCETLSWLSSISSLPGPAARNFCGVSR